MGSKCGSGSESCVVPHPLFAAAHFVRSQLRPCQVVPDWFVHLTNPFLGALHCEKVARVRHAWEWAKMSQLALTIIQYMPICSYYRVNA